MAPRRISRALSGSTEVKRLTWRRRWNKVFKGITFVAVLLSVVFLLVLLSKIFWDGIPHLNWKFLSSFVSRKATDAGIVASLAGTFWLMLLTGLFSIPLGIGSAIFIQEYMISGSRLKRFFTLNLANLAGLPSILYGLLGLTLFVRGLGLGGSLLSGALTMTLLILPTIIITSIEALKSVPKNLREAAFGLGARKWQVVFGAVIPSALPGIMTGLILASSRAIGEAAPIIVIGGLSFVAFLPNTPMDSFTALPLQIFNWASRPQKDFHDLASGAIVVLLVLLIFFNATSVWLRYYYGKRTKV